jgi:hypothetical protein
MFATRSSLADFVGRSPGIAKLAKAVRLKDTPEEAEAFVFLSHSHKDKELAAWARDFFARFGKDVYVDWWDPDMPTGPNAETADRLRKKMKNEKSKFVLLATENAVDCEWVSWELGYADGVKRASAIATFPIAAKPNQWAGNTYMLLYPRIEMVGSEWQVRFPSGLPLSLDGWLSLGDDKLPLYELAHAIHSLSSGAASR